MRTLIVTDIVSLDGYYVLGRRSYDMFRGFWPAVMDDAAATPEQKEIFSSRTLWNLLIRYDARPAA